MIWNPFKSNKSVGQKDSDKQPREKHSDKDRDAKYLLNEEPVDKRKEIDFGLASPDTKKAMNPKKAYEWLEEKVRTGTGEVIKVDTRSQSILELLDKKLYVYAEAHDKDAQVYSIVRIKNPTDISEYKKQLEKRRLENFVQVYASTVNIETLKDHTFSVGGI